ncbi:MAG: hypothetical protein CME56_04145 [Halieaceae bacterium]|nr:hypothetical protein [Halieaceae bacterium]|tara:strand:- start:343 stop:522 length:180 start_codon:yes stop_codon:yes gene_type:complete
MIKVLFYNGFLGADLNPHERDGLMFKVLFALLSLRLSTRSYNKHIDNAANLPVMGCIGL